MAKSMRAGGGGRTEALTESIEKREGYSKGRARAIAASIGRKKYGKRKFQKMASRGMRRR